MIPARCPASMRPRVAWSLPDAVRREGIGVVRRMESEAIAGNPCSPGRLATSFTKFGPPRPLWPRVVEWNAKGAIRRLQYFSRCCVAWMLWCKSCTWTRSTGRFHAPMFDEHESQKCVAIELHPLDPSPQARLGDLMHCGLAYSYREFTSQCIGRESRLRSSDRHCWLGAAHYRYR